MTLGVHWTSSSATPAINKHFVQSGHHTHSLSETTLSHTVIHHFFPLRSNIIWGTVMISISPFLLSNGTLIVLRECDPASRDESITRLTLAYGSCPVLFISTSGPDTLKGYILCLGRWLSPFTWTGSRKHSDLEPCSYLLDKLTCGWRGRRDQKDCSALIIPLCCGISNPPKLPNYRTR